MQIRALRTFSVWDGVQIHVFNAGKNGAPGEPETVSDKVFALCLETGNAEAVGELPQLDHDSSGAAGGSEPHDPPALTGKNKAALLAIAEAEGVAIEDGATNAAIVEAIEAARVLRQAQDGPEEGEDESGPPA